MTTETRKTPPRPSGTSQGSPRKHTASPRTVRSTRSNTVLQEKLSELIAAASLPFAMQGDDYCANIIASKADRVAEAWVKLADDSPAVKRVLTKMLEGSSWGEAMLATAGMVIPIAMHHNMFPRFDFIPGIKPPGKGERDSSPAHYPRPGTTEGATGAERRSNGGVAGSSSPPRPRPAGSEPAPPDPTAPPVGNRPAPGPAAVSIHPSLGFTRA